MTIVRTFLDNFYGHFMEKFGEMDSFFLIISDRKVILVNHVIILSYVYMIRINKSKDLVQI